MGPLDETVCFKAFSHNVTYAHARAEAAVGVLEDDLHCTAQGL